MHGTMVFPFSGAVATKLRNIFDQHSLLQALVICGWFAFWLQSSWMETCSVEMPEGWWKCIFCWGGEGAENCRGWCTIPNKMWRPWPCWIEPHVKPANITANWHTRWCNDKDNATHMMHFWTHTHQGHQAIDVSVPSNCSEWFSVGTPEPHSLNH